MQGNIIDETTGYNYVEPSANNQNSNVNGVDYVGPSGPLPGMPGSVNDGFNPVNNSIVNDTRGSHEFNPVTGLSREQYRDLWMSSGIRDIAGLQAFLAKYGGTLQSANGTAMTPYGDSLDMLQNARTGNGNPAWTNTGGSNNATTNTTTTGTQKTLNTAPVNAKVYAGNATQLQGRTTNAPRPVSNYQTVNSVSDAGTSAINNLSNSNAIYGPTSNTVNVPEYSAAFNRTQPQNDQQRPMSTGTNFSNQFNSGQQSYSGPSNQMYNYNPLRRY